MGISRKKQTLLKVGEFSSLETSMYYGGSPAAINHSGTVQLATNAELNLARSNSSALTYVGIFYNPSQVDSNTKNRVSTFLSGSAIVTLTKNSVNTNNTSINVDGTAGQAGDDYPYDTTLAWVTGDRLYIGATGLWQRTAETTGDPHYGVVLKAATNYLICLFYGSPSNWVNANA